jgi:hypothetical protein
VPHRSVLRFRGQASHGSHLDGAAAFERALPSDVVARVPAT